MTDLYASDDFKARIGRWRRALRTGLKKGKKAAPAVLLLGGAALGFIFSFGGESWITVALFTLLGALFGGGVLLAVRFVANNLSVIAMGAVVLVAAVLLWSAGIILGGSIIVAAYQLLISGIRAVLGM